MNERTIPFGSNAAGERSVAVSGSVTQSYLHTGDVIVGGIRSLSPDYAGRIHNFLVEYLGTPEHAVPFGGRGRELDSLDAWLSDPTSPPYLLITAPAGRGKSALLAHWVAALMSGSCGGYKVAFVPVSVRFRTNLEGVVFPSLAARLAELLNEDLTNTLGTSSEQWRGLVAEYLRALPVGERLLVIFDGADEAAGWQIGPDLLPTAPPPGLRVLVSARLTSNASTARDWLEQLGWGRAGLAASWDLSGLDRIGIQEALRSMGAPLDHAADQLDLVGELHRISLGDPLLVRLYVDALWGDRENIPHLNPMDLRRIRPGLEGYFTRWWEDQGKLWGSKEPLQKLAVRTVLNLLATALGPIVRDELLQLAAPDSGMDSRTLKDALRPIERFVVGDGRSQGYVFAHPRLAEFFWDERSPEGLSRAEQVQWESRFLEWGEQTLAALRSGERRPVDAPAYIVQYFGAHLNRSESTAARLGALLVKEWWQAWLALEGSYTGFSGDVERTWAAARKANAYDVRTISQPHHLDLEYRAALCQASITALTENLPEELPEVLVKSSVWSTSQAIAYATRIRNVFRRIRAVELLRPHLSQAQLEGATPELVQLARGLESSAKRLRALAAVAVHMSDSERLGIVAEVLRGLPEVDEADQARILEIVAPVVPATLKKVAWELARRIKNVPTRLSAEAAILPYLDVPDRPKAVTQTLRSIGQSRDHRASAQALSVIAPYLSRRQRERALDVARRCDSLWGRAWMLSILVPHLQPLDRQFATATAVELIPQIEPTTPWAAAVILRTLAPHLTEDNRNGALDTATGLKEDWARAASLAALAHYLDPVERDEVIDHAFDAARLVGESRKVHTLEVLAPHLSEGQLSEVLDEWVPELSEARRAQAIQVIASSFNQNQAIRAVALVRCFSGLVLRVRTFTALVVRLPSPEHREVAAEAISLAQQIGDAPARVAVLSRTAPRIPETFRLRVVEEVFALAHTDFKSLFDGFAGIAPFLTSTQADNVLDAIQELPEYSPELLIPIAAYLSAPQLTRALEATSEMDVAIRASNTAALAPHLPAEIRDGAVASALAAARNEEDLSMKFQALVALSSYLSEADREWLGDSLPEASYGVPHTSRVDVLAALMPYLDASQRRRLIESELLMIRARNPEVNMLRVLYRYMDHVQRGQADELLGVRERRGLCSPEHLTPTEVLEVLADLEEVSYEEYEELGLGGVIRMTAIEAGKTPRALLSAVSAHLSDELILKMFRGGLFVEDKENLAWILDCLLEQLSPQVAPRVYEIWADLLTQNSQLGRANLLSSTSALARIAEWLGGSAAVAGIAGSVIEVGHWWP